MIHFLVIKKIITKYMIFFFKNKIDDETYE
jgi:hypothetical protein